MYEVFTLPKAESDIIRNTDYIYYVKKSPEVAIDLYEGLRDTISKLSFMPQMHEIDEDSELTELKIRKCYYKNYKIFFYIDSDENKVYVLRVLHMLVDSKPLLLNVMPDK